MPKKQFRMMPVYGGTPLPWPPIVTPCQIGPILMRKVAADYVKVLDKELATGEDGTPQKWSGAQRRYIRQQRAKWVTRSEGKDPHYAIHGTHARPMQAEPPGPSDAQTLRLRRAAMERGDYVTNKEHYRQNKWAMSSRVRADIVKRWKATAKAAAKKKTLKSYDEDKNQD